MARTDNKRRKSQNSGGDILHGTNKPLVKTKPQKPIASLLAEAATHITQSQPELALPLATSAVSRLETGEGKSDVSLPAALCLLAEIRLELGDADTARVHYRKAVELDPEGTLGAEVWFSLAQLSEVGGVESIDFYETGAGILRREISEVDGEGEGEDVGEAKGRLADALCAMAEVYMTDLSWEADAETRCEAYVTEAVAICPESAGVLQTLASVRISQERIEEARSALQRSLALWRGLPTNVETSEPGEEADEEETGVPDFPTRISLARLLMEVELEKDALEVLDRLVLEDDESVEAWYLGGWGRILLAEKTKDQEERLRVKQAARDCLANALRLYEMLSYEDEPLQQHARELVQKLLSELGEEDEEWEDEEEADGEADSDEIAIADLDVNHDHDGDVDMT